MLRSALVLALMSSSAASASAQSALIHGNYCGPGNNAPRPPIDALDAACARHDACTPTGGLPSTACNARLRRAADRLAHDPRQPEDLRALAGLVAAGARLMLADDRPRGRPLVRPAAGHGGGD